MLSHRSVATNFVMTALMHGRTRADVVVSALPCPHVYGNVVFNSTFYKGGTLVMHAVFDVDAMFDSIQEHKATMFEGVPTMYMYMLDHHGISSVDFSSIRTCTVGGQTMPVSKMEAVESTMACPLIELWGMTEIGGLGTTFVHDGVSKHGSIGVALPYTRVKISDVEDANNELPVGEVGELMICGPIVMQGYLDHAVSAAGDAFKTWSKTSIEECKQVVAKLADALEANAEDSMALLTQEQGKPRGGAEWEVLGSAAWLRAISEQTLEDEVVEDSSERSVVTRFTPLGVVGAIVPWNFPLLLAVWKIAPALMAGCTVVVKPSPYTPLCDLKFAEMAIGIVPPGVLNCVSGGNDQGQCLTEHPDIAKIAFTGSTATGRKVMGACAESIKRVTLELGGNDPAIVLPDADAKQIAPQLFWAAFQNNAQFCNASKRLYIHESAYDEVRDALIDFVRAEVVVGDGANDDT